MYQCSFIVKRFPSVITMIYLSVLWSALADPDEVLEGGGEAGMLEPPFSINYVNFMGMFRKVG